ncbi:IS256 family transposase [Bacillus sp. FJAT-42376]|uniref:IS256 family transposase n=1 Tax=Bacillus sp. FJAT-42376 TaxID=2014076 RepID=UPI000F510E2E|nr:IS256 family transposase [Bacillus sp. FJAT-42376]AZB41550.1 IS256 family transposase [Bacillus sp. FJAT-42376]AZB42788.1 IS256 family transposase [Bacillus sp. FJAT-42376]
MTQINLTLNVEDLKDHLLNSNLDAVVKSSLVLILNQVMESERDEHLNADAYERTSGRTDYRNGYYERDFLVSIGKINLKVPRTRNGEFSTSVFEKYKRADQALVLSMMEMVVNGVSTRKVTKIMEQLCGESVSKSLVSSITKKLDPIVNEWASRPLNVMYYKYVFVDALYIKVREHQRVVSKAVYVAVGVNSQLKREVIGLAVNHSESKEGWTQFFSHLKSRGFQSPKLMISDAHKGLKAAIQESFVGTSWQRCTFHFKKNLFDRMPKKQAEELKHALLRIFDAAKPEDARALKEEFMHTYDGERGYETVLTLLDDGFEDAIQFMNEPLGFQKKLRTTNNLERLNAEIRRRERVIRIFPNTQSAFRLIGAVLMDYEKSLDPGDRKYMYDVKEN